MSASAIRPLALRCAMAAVMIAAAGVATACGSSSNAASAGARFENDFLEFGYPTGWKPSAFKITGELHFAPMLYLSSQPVRQPCRTHGSTTVCGWPLTRLRPGGTLIVWENRGAPGWTLKTIPGRPLRVGGRAAKQVVDKPGECAAIGADETIEVTIERPVPNNWTAFTACLRGPGLSASEQEVATLLASTHFKTP